MMLKKYGELTFVTKMKSIYLSRLELIKGRIRERAFFELACYNTVVFFIDPPTFHHVILNTNTHLFIKSVTV